MLRDGLAAAVLQTFKQGGWNEGGNGRYQPQQRRRIIRLPKEALLRVGHRGQFCHQAKRFWRGQPRRL